MKKCYAYYWGSGPYGAVDSIFIADEYALESSRNRLVNHQDMLSRSSAVYQPLDLSRVTLLSADPDKIAWLESLMENSSAVLGPSPLHYLEID